MIGTDIVHIPRFERSVEGEVGEALLARMFSEDELDLGDLSRIRILRHSSGRLHVEIEGKGLRCRRYEVSLSHDHEYAIAVALRCPS